MFKFLSNQPAYRLQQAKRAIFFDLINDWSQASTLPKSLRESLNQQFPLPINGQIFSTQSDPTVKALITLSDGVKIETVLLQHLDRRQTVCVSAQAGCPLACKFCATGQLGFIRNLTAGEIIDQFLFWSRYLKSVEPREDLNNQSSTAQNHQLITNVVFMGMGEPFLNYEEVLKAVRIINEPDGGNIGARHISISTIGITEGIKRLAQEKLQVNLAISLHAPTEELRCQLIPASKKYPLSKIFPAVDAYLNKTKRRVMFEYLMIRGVNDSLKSAQQLAKLMEKPLYFVNLITYNQTGNYRPSEIKTIKLFREVLEKAGVAVTQRYRFGQNIKAACGQLVAADL